MRQPAPPADAAWEDSGSGMVFVGRTDELGALATELGRAEGGEPRVVLIEGEAGVGKSSLLSRFVSQRAPGDRARW